MEWAASMLLGCPSSGPRVVALRWGSPPSDSTELRLLGSVSTGVRDRRTLAAVTAVAANSSQPRHVRLEAIRTLVTYYDPSVVVDYRTRSLPSGEELVPVLGSWSSPRGLDGDQPLPATVKEDIISTLRQIGGGDGDQTVVKVVKKLVKELQG